MSTLHDFSAATLDGKPLALNTLAGKLVLVVNTASRCGLTPHYAGLETLYKHYADQGLVVLGFPCNQFGAQEPGSADEIASFCSKNYGVSFPMCAKIDVNGETAHPLYQWLTQHSDSGQPEPIKWNFAKFLIGRNGAVIRRYAPQVEPSALAADIEAALA